MKAKLIIAAICIILLLQAATSFMYSVKIYNLEQQQTKILKFLVKGEPL